MQEPPDINFIKECPRRQKVYGKLNKIENEFSNFKYIQEVPATCSQVSLSDMSTTGYASFLHMICDR